MTPGKSSQWTRKKGGKDGTAAKGYSPIGSCEDVL